MHFAKQRYVFSSSRWKIIGALTLNSFLAESGSVVTFDYREESDVKSYADPCVLRFITVQTCRISIRPRRVVLMPTSSSPLPRNTMYVKRLNGRLLSPYCACQWRDSIARLSTACAIVLRLRTV